MALLGTQGLRGNKSDTDKEVQEEGKRKLLVKGQSHRSAAVAKIYGEESQVRPPPSQ
jgi:hypothetical protein